MTNENSASTVFSGHFLEEQVSQEFCIDWLMIIKNGAGTVNYTKKGEFSSIDNRTPIEQFPMPSFNIDLCFHKK